MKTRQEITEFVIESFNKIHNETQQFQHVAQDRYDAIVREKEHIKEYNLWMYDQLQKEQKEFMEKANEEAKAKGLLI